MTSCNYPSKYDGLHFRGFEKRKFALSISSPGTLDWVGGVGGVGCGVGDCCVKILLQ